MDAIKLIRKVYMIYLFTVGISLSGKTWLLKKIEKEFPKKFATIETRDIHDMLNKMGVFVDDNSIKGDSYDIRQRFTKEIRDLLIRLYAKEKINIVQDSCNRIKKDRDERVSAVKEVIPDIKTVLIFVNTDSSVIYNRAQKEDKRIGKEIWVDLFEKQRKEFEVPTADEADFFIEYDGKDWREVAKKLREIIRNEV